MSRKKGVSVEKWKLQNPVAGLALKARGGTLELETPPRSHAEQVGTIACEGVRVWACPPRASSVLIPGVCVGSA